MQALYVPIVPKTRYAVVPSIREMTDGRENYKQESRKMS